MSVQTFHFCDDFTPPFFILHLFYTNSSKLIKFCQNLAQLGSSRLIFFYIFFYKKDAIFYKDISFLLHLLICPIIHPVIPQLSALLSAQLSTRLSAQLSIQLSILVIRPVIRPVVRQVICPVICPIISWCLMLPNLTIQVIKLSDGNLQCE